MTVWGGASNTTLNPLLVTQKKTTRAISGLKTTGHANDSFITLKLLKVKDLHSFASLVYNIQMLTQLDIIS